MGKPYTKKLPKPSNLTSLLTLVLGFSTSTIYLNLGILLKNPITLSNCSVDKESTKFYWCPVAGKCEKFPAYIYESMLSANKCGYDKLTNQKIYPFLSEEDCHKNIEPCDIYNNKKNSNNKNKENCLNNMYCGWCTNNNGIGKCVSGTSSGPINIYKYNFCKVNNPSNKNSYSYRKKIIF